MTLRRFGLWLMLLAMLWPSGWMRVPASTQAQAQFLSHAVEHGSGVAHIHVHTEGVDLDVQLSSMPEVAADLGVEASDASSLPLGSTPHHHHHDAGQLYALPGWVVRPSAVMRVAMAAREEAVPLGPSPFIEGPLRPPRTTATS